MSYQTSPKFHHAIPAEHLPPDPSRAWEEPRLFAFVCPTQDGIRLAPDRPGHAVGGADSDLIKAMTFRGLANGFWTSLDDTIGRDGRQLFPNAWRNFTREVLALPHSERWQEAVSTALLGNWCKPLWRTGNLPSTAVGAIRAEARILHRQLVPVWRRRTRHGRVLSLDANLGEGLSLYDLVAADIDLLTRVPGGVFDDERLNTVLCALEPAEQQVVLAYAEDNGITWTEAAASAGALDPEAFGQRVRRKTKRLAAEHQRRTVLRKIM
ncbi:hypothetical protein [Streptomyces sp. NPDC001759]